MAGTRGNCVTLAALLGLLKPTERLFVIHRMGADISEAVAGGTVEELRATRCVEICGDNIVERLTVDIEGYPWEQEATLLVTIGGKAAKT